MSIAKKSVKWLVAFFVIFALILTASLAVSNVTRASATEPEAAAADTEIALSVIAKGAVTNEAYPDLLSSSSDRTVTVEYYFDIPAAIEEDLETWMKFDIFMTLPDNSKVKPTNIEVNTAVASAVTMDALTNAAEEGYLDDAATAATKFGIQLKPTHTMSELRGFTKSGTTYTLGNYFFKATYTVPASTDGVFSFGFGETSEVPANEASESEDAIIYVPEVTNVTTDTVMDGIDDVTAVSTGIFYVRSYIDVPVAVSGLIFDNTQQTAIVDKDGYAFVIGDLVNDIYPVFYHDEWPTGFSLVPETYIGGVEAQQSHGTFALINKDIYVWRIPDGNDGYTYSTDNYTVNWSIAKRAITAPVSAGTTYTYDGTEQSFEFSADPLTDAAYITITGTPQTNVGEYTVTAALRYPASTYWAGDATDVAAKTFPFVINPALITVPTPADVTYTYNGEEQSFQWASTPDELITITGTPQTAAGEYTITASIPANYAWNDEGHTTADKTFPFVIAKVQITKPTPLDNVQYVYDSYNKQFMLDVVSAETGYYTVSNNIRRNAGTQTVTVSLKDKSNTQWADGTTANLEFTFTVQPRPVNLSVSADAASHVYGDTPANVSISATGIIDAFSCSYKVVCVDGEAPYAEYTPTQFNEGLNAGHYTLNPVYNDINGNYDVTVSEPFSYEVIKREITIPTAISGLEYTGSAQVGVTKTDGSFYTLYSGSDEETAVGNYSATYRLNSTTNCYWAGDTTDVADKTVLWSIGKKQIVKPSISASFKIYNGTSQSYSGSGTGYTFTGSGTNAGEYPVTVTLTDKDNSVWAGTDSADDYNEADKLVINKKTVKLTLSESAESSVYGNAIATITAGINPDYAPINTADIGTVSYTAKNFQTNVVYSKADFETVHTAPVGSYILTAACSIDNPNYSVDAQTLPYQITKRQIEIPVLNEDDPSFIYSGSAQGISFFAGSMDDADYFTLSGTNSATNVGNYTYTATLNDATNCEWEDETTAAKNYDWSITTRYITVPTVEDDTFDYDGNEHSIGFSNVDNDYVDITYDTQSAIGVYTDTTSVALKAAFAGNIAWDDDNHTTAAKTYTLTIEVVEVNFTIVPIFNGTEKTGAATVQNVLTALPAATTYRWFKFTGYTLGANAVSHVSLDMEGETVYANYTYAVGAGDVDGDGVISTADVILLKRWNVGLDRAKEIADAAAAWAKTDDSSVTSAVLYTALDANNNGAIRSNDVVAVREALATGRTYKVLVKNGIVQVAKANRVTVSSYEDLLGNIHLGNPVTLGADIDAANEIFNEDSLIPVDIDLGDHRLTVKGFTLNTATAGATLKINNGTLYTVTGIAVTAPNGNVIVDDVNGYSYDGTVVNLSAYSESLHIASDVAFYIYKAQDPVTNEDYADVHAFVADVYPEEETVETIAEVVATIQTLANTRIGETEARMAEIAEIKASDKTEEQKAIEINAKDVKKAIIEVPIDTHVVVEEAASLSVDKVVVKAQANEATSEEEVVKTFSIEVKNAAAEVVTVDISEVKETIEEVDYYVVEEVAISGNTAKVEVVAGENTAAEVKKYVAQIGTTGYESLQAAIDAAVNYDTIKLLASVTDGTGLMTADDNKQKTKIGKTFTIDFAGFTYTVNGAAVGSTGTETQAMHWGEKDNITLKNGSLVISVKGATVPNPANNKIIKMAMQNYANLTVKDMTMDFSNIVVRNYGTYTGKDAPYSGLEIPLFNLNAGSMTIENTTITMPNDSTKGVLIEIPDAATIKNSTINGYVSLGQLTSNVTIVDSTVTGVVSYFAGYGVKHSGNVYRLGGVSVTNATELQAALDAGAIIIDIENDFNAPNPIAVTKSTIINGYDHTITSNGNRIMNVTEAGVVLTINDLTMTSATSERGLNIWDSATDTDITLNNVTIDAHLYAINYVNGADNETLTINNSSITGWAAINAHCNNSTFTVTDSTLYGINRNCDSQYGFSTVVIDGDSLFGSQEGDHGVDNTFVFDGCTIIAEVTLTHQYWISFQYAATGNVASVVVNNCQILDAPNGNDKSADMKIDGTNNAVVMPLSAEQYAIVAAKHFNITDNGNGTYTIMPKTANISYFGTPYNFYDVFENGWLEDTEAFTLTDDVVLDTDVVFATNRAAAIAVSGGTFEMNLDGNTISGVGKILLPVGVTCVTDSNVSIASVFEAPEGEVIIESVDADGNYIYAVGVAYVKTKAEFTAAITAGAKKLVICADINLSMYTYNRDMDITIDLNGHTLTTTMTGITFSAARTLNIVDSSANGTGAINSTGNYAINMGTASTADTVINVYGGTLTGKTSAAVKVNDGTLNVYGGTFTCPAADKYAILNYQGYAGTVNIYDGTFTAAVAVANNGTGEVNIYGGTFSADPSDFVADGYYVVTSEVNEVTMYTVVGATYVANAAELTAALAAKAPYIIVTDDIESTNGFLVTSNTKLDLNQHTVTVETGANVNNRAFKITSGTLTIFNGEINALGGGTTSSNGYGCYGAFRAEVGTKLIANDLTLRNSRPWGLNVKLLGATAELTNVDIISAYGGGIEVTDDEGADGTVTGYAKMVNCSVTQSGYFDHCSSAVSVSGASTLDVYSTDYTAEYGVYVFSSGGTINIYGGTFTALSKNVLQTSYDATYGNAAIINVYDGTFYGTFGIVANGTTMNVYGGTFDHDPTAYVAAGYGITEADGIYTVAALEGWTVVGGGEGAQGDPGLDD